MNGMNPPDQFDHAGIRLVLTCGACPEQYDATDQQGRQVGYLRLRHGGFSVECPGCRGDLVYTAEPRGDGEFYDDEREQHLRAACEAIARWVAEKGETA